MKVFKVLQDKSKWFYFYVLMLGVIRSLLQSVILILINNIAAKKQVAFLRGYEWLLFTGAVVMALVVSRAFQIFMIRLTNQVLYGFEVNILKRLRFTSYQAMENFGNAKIYTVLGDIRTLSNLPLTFANCFNAAVVILCSMVYFFIVSPVGGTVVLLLMIALAFFYAVRNRHIEKELNQLRDMNNEFYRYIGDFLYGFKEIKMSQVRSSNIYTRYLEKNRKDGQDLTNRTSIQYLDNELTGSYSWFVVIGVIMFVLPAFIHLNADQTTTMIITILFLISPVTYLIISLPEYARAKVAFERLEEFESKMDLWNGTAELPSNPASDDTPFESLEMQQVVYEYFDREKEKTFVVGPIDIRIKKGELIFVTGGNGSGKSTFVKLLTGLYKPGKGLLCLNGKPVAETDYPAYRDRISAIFTDNYLLGENYSDFDLGTGNARLNEYINLMELSGIFRVADGKYSLTNKLSKGQQKRLALIYALLEERQVLVLDEWAAEQDPAFRHYFYRTLIPLLLRMDKTIILVTHDSSYFDQAGRIVQFDYGLISSDRSVGNVSIYQNAE